MYDQDIKELCVLLWLGHSENTSQVGHACTLDHGEGMILKKSLLDCGVANNGKFV